MSWGLTVRRLNASIFWMVLIYHLQHIWAFMGDQAEISGSHLIGFQSLKCSLASVIRLSWAPPLTFDFISSGNINANAL